MTYTPTTWTDEVPAASPVKYTIRTSGGTILYDDVQIDVKTSITTPGTAVNAANLNHIEQGIQTLENATPPKVFTAKGDLFAATGNGAGSRLAVGSNGYVLEASSLQSVGMKWGTYCYYGYERNAVQAISNSTLTIIDYNMQTQDGSVDLDGLITLTTGANWRMTFSGGYNIYLVTAAACFEASTAWSDGESAMLALYKNGSLLNWLDYRIIGAGGYSQSIFVGGSRIIRVTTNDYIDLRISQNSGGSLNLDNQPTHNWIRVARLR